MISIIQSSAFQIFVILSLAGSCSSLREDLDTLGDNSENSGTIDSSESIENLRELRDREKKKSITLTKKLEEEHTDEFEIFKNNSVLNDENVDFILEKQEKMISQLRQTLESLNNKKKNLLPKAKDIELVEHQIQNKQRDLFSALIKKKVMDQITSDKFTIKFFNQEHPILGNHDTLSLPKQSEIVEEDSDDFKDQEEVDQDEEVLRETDKMLNKRNLTDEEEINLETEFRKMHGRDIDSKFETIINKKTLTYKSAIDVSFYEVAMRGLVLARFFYRRHHIVSFLEQTFKSYFYCTMSLTKKNGQIMHLVRINKPDKQQKAELRKVKNPMKLIGKERQKSKFYNSSVSKSKMFNFTYERFKKFNEDFNCLCELIDNMNYFIGRAITESKLDKSMNMIDPLPTVYNTGRKIESVILKYYDRFQELKNRLEDYIQVFEEAVHQVDCDVKDMMSFYSLLPRFHLVYTRIHSNLQNNENSVISFYRDKVTETLYKWQQSNKSFFHYFSFFLFWLSYAESIFELPFSLSINKDFKYTMIERSAESWLDTTTQSLKYRSDSDLLIMEYKDIFEDIRQIFEGVEEFASIKIPFGIIDINKFEIRLCSFVFFVLFFLFK